MSIATHICLAINVAVATALSPALLAGDVQLSGCIVSLKDQALVPAPQAGVLLEVAVREGQRLQAGEAIAHIDDAQQRLEYEMALSQREAAMERATDDTSVRHASAAQLVADAELQSAVAINRRVAGTHSANDLRRLTLASQKAKLLVEKMAADRRIAAIEVRSCDVSLALAKQQFHRCAVASPMAGEVVEILKHAGEWVNPGEPIVRMVRLDTLRIEGFVNAAEHSPASMHDRPVKISVNMAQGRTAEFSGRVVYVRPTLQAGEQFLIYAEVENRAEQGQWLLRPGMLAEMRVEVSPAEKNSPPSRTAHASR